jgi:surfeit locus 1 family protein
VRGHFLHDKEVYFFAQGMKGAVGVQIITPLVEDDGTTILVNRGFVPDSLKDPGSRGAGQVAGEVSLSGVVRVSQNPGLFTPKSDPVARLWFVKNVPEIAAFLGVDVNAPIFVEADDKPNPGGWPLGGQTNVDFPNDHLQYAMTWFGLALALTAVYLVYHHSRGRLTLRS